MNFSKNNFFVYLVVLIFNPIFIFAMELQSKHQLPSHIHELSSTKQSAFDELMGALSSFDSQDQVRLSVDKIIKGEKVVDFSKKDKFGKTALWYALMLPDTSVAQLIIEAAPSLVNKQDEFGKTPLYYQICNKRCDNVRFLIENNASLIVAEDETGEVHALRVIAERASKNSCIAGLDDAKGLGSWDLTRSLSRYVASKSSFEDIKRAEDDIIDLIIKGKFSRAKNNKYNRILRRLQSIKSSKIKTEINKLKKDIDKKSKRVDQLLASQIEKQKELNELSVLAIEKREKLNGLSVLAIEKREEFDKFSALAIKNQKKRDNLSIVEAKRQEGFNELSIELDRLSALETEMKRKPNQPAVEKATKKHKKSSKEKIEKAKKDGWCLISEINQDAILEDGSSRRQKKQPSEKFNDGGPSSKRPCGDEGGDKDKDLSKKNQKKKIKMEEQVEDLRRNGWSSDMISVVNPDNILPSGTSRREKQSFNDKKETQKKLADQSFKRLRSNEGDNVQNKRRKFESV